jgi:hypothetical protein
MSTSASYLPLPRLSPWPNTHSLSSRCRLSLPTLSSRLSLATRISLSSVSLLVSPLPASPTILTRARAKHLSPEAPASRPFRRQPTPRYMPDSPASPIHEISSVPHADITYDLSRVAIHSSRSSAPSHPHQPARPPLPHLGLPITQWGDGPLDMPPAALIAAPTWNTPTWGEDTNDHQEPEPEPQSWGLSRPPSRSSSDSFPDDDDYDSSLYHYVQTRSSFQGGPRNTRNPLSTRLLLVGLDSYSDVTVASRDIVYNVHPVLEHLSTGGGDTEYMEEGLVDIVDGPCSFRTIPALVATQPSHLPHNCLLLLGVPQLNDLDIKLDTHRTSRRLPLQSYDPTIDFSADTHLQCRMSEKDLLAWAEHHKDTPVGYTKYSHEDVIYSINTLSPDELTQLRDVSSTYKNVYDAAKGALPALAKHPPVTLTSKRGGSTSLYLSPSGAPAPPQSSHAGLER